jgi:pyridoxal phosphate enzyme (YggS family)
VSEAVDPGAVAANVAAVRERVAAAAERAGRDPGEVTLVAVAKLFPAAAVRAVVEAGVADVGENYAKDLERKAAEVPGVHWHFVGRLQRNKAKLAVQLFDVVEAVDRLELAEALSSSAAAAGRTLEVLLQVNVSAEPQKGGAIPEALAPLVEAVSRLAALRLVGLMTVPAASEHPEATRPAFARLRELRDGLCLGMPGLTLPELSMGMSADFEIAIEEGASIVRVGSALFGARGGPT